VGKDCSLKINNAGPKLLIFTPVFREGFTGKKHDYCGLLFLFLNALLCFPYISFLFLLLKGTS